MTFVPPAEVAAVLTAFAPLFTRLSWIRAQALVCGALLAPKGNTVTAALRALGLGGDLRFQNYHRLLIQDALVAAACRPHPFGFAP
jgi:hypothetical protein